MSAEFENEIDSNALLIVATLSTSFENDPEMLEKHRGIDIDALKLTNTITAKMQQGSYLHTVTRLLVDLNWWGQGESAFCVLDEKWDNLQDDIARSLNIIL